MPRQESLSAITPNRYYRLQATLKYKRQTENYTTAIIEEDNVQKKILLPLDAHELIEGAKYDFPKCFYSSSEWIRVKETQGISLLEPKSMETNSLAEIYENREKLNGTCLSVILKITDIKKPEKKMKNGQELKLVQMRGLSDNKLVLISFWNTDIPEFCLGKKVLLEGLRLKLLNDNSIILVSTVYTKFTELDQQSIQGEPNIKYEDISDIYTTKRIAEMEEQLSLKKYAHSIINCKILESEMFSYEGCVDCHKKVDGQDCTFCHKTATIGKFNFLQMLLGDDSGEVEVFVFDPSIQGVLNYCKKGSNLTARIKSAVHQENQMKTCHILSSIQFVHF